MFLMKELKNILYHWVTIGYTCVQMFTIYTLRFTMYSSLDCGTDFYGQQMIMKRSHAR